MSRPNAEPAGGAASRRFALTLGGLVLLQGLLWIGLPLLLEGSIRLDVAEGVVDGPEWRLSYFRHPPFSSWLSGLAAMAGPLRYGAVYAIGWALASGSFAIAAVFIARVEKKGAAGLIALMAGLASPFATYVPIQVNHNIGVMPFWAATLVAAWFAFEGGALGAWALLGVAVGLGLWAKYAILHLVIPLVALFFIVPPWRARILSAGPWLAAAICIALIAPHFIDVAHKGATTLRFATRTLDAAWPVRLGWIAEFILDCAAVQAGMALIALAACGRKALMGAIAVTFARATRTRLDLFLHAAAFGPILVITGAAPFGVHTHYLWVTPLTLSFAAWWGHAAARAGLRELPPLAYGAYGALAAVFVVSYIGVRELDPMFARNPTYPEMDGPALAALAQKYWAEHASGEIPYIVSLDEQRGLQAAGSIVFDLPYRVRVLRDGEPVNAPWLDLADLKQRGALVVAPRALAEGTKALGVAVRDIARFERPMARGAKPPAIYFGVMPPEPSAVREKAE